MNFNILVCGSGNEGKTTFLEQSVKISDDITHVKYISNYGLISLNITESNKYDSTFPLEKYDAEIIMFDLSRPGSFEEVPPTIKPRVIVGNKSDHDRTSIEEKNRIKSMGYAYYETNHNLGCSPYVKPLAYLLSKLIGDDFMLPISYLTDKQMVIYTGIGNGGKSTISKKTPTWIQSNENALFVWSNEDDPSQKPTEFGYVPYQEFIRTY